MVEVLGAPGPGSGTDALYWVAGGGAGGNVYYTSLLHRMEWCWTSQGLTGGQLMLVLEMVVSSTGTR